jgi:hypothetical protein
MILLNFTHPLTGDQRAAIEQITGQAIERLIDLPAHFDQAQPFVEQVRTLVEATGLTPGEWQGAPILVNPPALAAIAVTLLAELHGRMGYFPPVVRLRPVEGALPPRYEVAEIINLQQVRDRARETRTA